MAPRKERELRELDRLYQQFQKATTEVAGYPLSQFFNYSKLLRFFKFHINNLGDPFRESWYYRINTLSLEKEVIDQFAELFHAPKESYWGYVTNGGTEGNLYGLYVARELYPDGVVFYSDQTHYSVPKSIHLLRMPSVKVKSLPCGTIDYQDLQTKLSCEERTPILFANIGTTMKGAVDDVQRIQEILSDLKIPKHYIHCDAAFFGMILPFLPEFQSQPFDFRTGINSIAISGHKLIGTPIPCGVVLVRKEHMHHIGTQIEYTGAKDVTISGSRNGLTPLFLWHEINGIENGRFAKLVKTCISLAGYAIKRFDDLGIHAWRNKNSIIVVFPRPSDKLVRKWQLAVEGDIAHLITLPHVNKKMIDLFVSQVVSDLKKSPRKHRKGTRLP